LSCSGHYGLIAEFNSICTRRTDEAVKAMQPALQLDPFLVRMNADLGMAFLVAGRYGDAVAREGRTLELAPGASTP
jgi:hypothetical protein